MLSSLVVVHYLDITRAIGRPDKADPEFLVESDAMPSNTSAVPVFAKDLITPGIEERQHSSITYTVIRNKGRPL